MSDTTLDYPLQEDVFSLLDLVQAKTISRDFDEQLDAAEELYGQQIHFSFKKADIDRILKEAYVYEKRR